MTKPKIFVYSDSPTVKTGFGIVAENLLKEAHKEFDVSILGINEFGRHRYDATKYFIYSTDPTDPLGLKRIEQTLEDVNPDIIFLFQDIFHIQQVIPTVKKICPNKPIITYFPVDGTPFNPVWNLPFQPGVVSQNITYSQFAVNTIYERFPELINKLEIKILHHGVDVEVFKLLSKQERREIKQKMGWKDKFVAINVNRFQPRKIIPLTLRAFSLVTHGYKKCKCGNYYLLHKKYCDLSGCDMTKVVDTVLPKNDVALYLHSNTSERTMGPGSANSLQAHAINAGYSDRDFNTKALNLIANRNIIGNPFTEKELCEFYNAADINVTTAIGEGWGLSLSEAAACGTSSIAPNNSAIPEVLEGTNSILVKNIGHFNMGLDSGHLRPLVSVPRFVDAIETKYKEWVDNGRKKVIDYDAIAKVNKDLLWSDKREFLMNEFKRFLPQFFKVDEDAISKMPVSSNLFDFNISDNSE